MPRLLLYEMGVHYLDTFRFLFGDPQAVFARIHHISPHTAGEDVQILTLSYPHMTAVVTESWASVQVEGLDTIQDPPPISPPPRLEIDGTEGTLVMFADGTMRVTRDNDKHEWTIPWESKTESRAAALQHFADCMHEGTPFETSGRDTLKTMALLYSCYRSAEEGVVVRPEELYPGYVSQ